LLKEEEKTKIYLKKKKKKKKKTEIDVLESGTLYVPKNNQIFQKLNN